MSTTDLVWIAVLSTVTVCSGTAVTLYSPRGERLSTALFFAGWTAATWGTVGLAYLVGWWKP